MTKYALIRTDLDGSTTEITTGTKAEMTERYDACYQTNLNEQYQARGKAQARKTMLSLVKRIENVLA